MALTRATDGSARGKEEAVFLLCLGQPRKRKEGENLAGLGWLLLKQEERGGGWRAGLGEGMGQQAEWREGENKDFSFFSFF
jgi:hypothetical protein